MVSLELEILARVGCASIDSSGETERIHRRPPLDPFTPRDVRAVLAVLRGFELAPETEIAEDVRNWLREFPSQGGAQ